MTVIDPGNGQAKLEDGDSGRYRLIVDKQIPPEWDALSAGRQPTVRARWLRLAPQRLPGDPVVFLLENDGAIRVGVSGVVMPAPSANSRIDPYSIFSGASTVQGLAPGGPHPWQGLPAARIYPCLLLMLPHYEMLPVGPAAAEDTACTRLVAEIVWWARHTGVRSIAAEYLTPEARALRRALRSAGFTIAELASRCDMDVVWTDFGGYLATLPARRRVVIRRELRALDERGIQIVARGLRPEEDELVALRCQLVEKYGGQPHPAKEQGMLDRLRSEFRAGEVTVFAASRGDRMLGFSLFVQEGVHWVPLLTGSDYGDQDARFTYFATLFYRPCAEAAGRGVTKISFGLGSWEAKRLRGCYLSPLEGAAALVDEVSPAAVHSSGITV